MNRLPTLSDAAKQLGVTRTALFAELRRLKIIDDRNLADHRQRANGLLTEQRGFGKNAGRAGTYWVTVVTPRGLSYLQGITNAMDPKGKVVDGKRCDVSSQRGESSEQTDLRSMGAHESLGYSTRSQR